jgi:putative sterol carrier protein
MELSESIVELLDKKAEELGPVEFLKRIGKNVFDILGLMAEAANGSEDVRGEISGWDRVIQFKAPGTKTCRLVVAGGKLSAKLGETKKADVTFETNSVEDLMGMLTGAMDGTQMYMSGKLRIEGQLSDAIKFGTIGQLIQKVLTNPKIREIWKLDTEDLAQKLGIKT